MKKVVLLKEHRHQGTLFLVGSPLMMSVPEADWLIKNNIARVDSRQKQTKVKIRGGLPS